MRITRRHHWQRSWLLPWLVALVGLAISVFASLHILRDDRERQREEFAAQVEQHTHALETAFEADESTLWAIAGLFNASEQVTRAEFRTFVVPYFDYFHRNRFYQALGWAPRVPGTGRHAYEEAVRSQGFLQFSITERVRADDRRLVMVPAGRQEEYVPVGYIEPLADNEALLGYDLASTPRRREALYRARDTGELTATGPIILHEESGARKWLLVCLPIYAGKRIPSTVAERRRLLMGFAFGVYRISDMIDAMVASHLRKGMSVAVFDEVGESPQTPLYGQLRPQMPLQVATKVAFAGRDWLLVWRGGSDFAGPYGGTPAWVIIGAGVGLTALVVVILVLLQARARQAEREAERDRLILHTSMDGFSRAGFDGRLLDVNAAFCDMVGYSRAELLSMRISDLDAKESPEETARHMRAVREAGHGRFETKHRRKDGETVEVEISTSVCRFPDKEALVVFARDITERKRADEALRESEERFREIVEVASDAVWEIDEEARYTYWSPRVTDILGYAPEEIIGKTPFYLMPPDEAKRVADAFAAIAAAREPFTSLENTNLHKDGHAVVLETSGVPIFDGEGRFRGYRGVEHDVTERIAAQRALESQNRRLEALNTIAAAAGSTLDVDVLASRALDAALAVTGAPGGGIYVSAPDEGALVLRARRGALDTPAAEELQRLSLQGERVGQVEAFLSGRTTVVRLAETLERLDPDSPLYRGLEALHKNGIGQSLCVPVLCQGRAVGVICQGYPEEREFDPEDVRCLEAAAGTIGVAIDQAILYEANQQRAEELARANEELKSLDRMKNEFISLVGHELRTPLAGILGYAEFLLEEDLPPKEAHEFAVIIHRESERLARLVNAVLDLNKMEAGRMEYRKVTEDLNDIVRVAAASMESAAERRNQHLRLALAPEPLTAEFDPDRIQQVLLNLLSNAVKFSPQHSEIEVGTRSDDGSVVAWVRDQGTGIGPEDMPRIFERFVQANHSDKRLEGSGLGLPICKGIVEDGHAGKMWAESPGAGRGATFYFRIPRHAADESTDR